MTDEEKPGANAPATKGPEPAGDGLADFEELTVVEFLEPVEFGGKTFERLSMQPLQGGHVWNTPHGDAIAVGAIFEIAGRMGGMEARLAARVLGELGPDDLGAISEHVNTQLEEYLDIVDELADPDFNPRDAHTIKLQVPVAKGKKSVDAIDFKPLKGKHIWRQKSAGMVFGDLLAIAVKQTSQPDVIFRRLRVHDLAAVMQAVQHFLTPFLPTGGRAARRSA